jgi:glycosyltransferase involved in cell wall biosynthesis
MKAIEERFPKVADRLAYVRWGGTGDDDLDLSSDLGYIFSGGRTNRDFATLYEAVAPLSCPTVIVAGGEVEFPSSVPAHITIHQDIPLDEFQRLLRGARIIVVPLKRDDVSSGQVVLNRAMRSGKPVVVTATAGIADYVVDGKDALLVAPEDVEDLRDSLTRLLDDPELRRELGLAARRTYERSFNSRVFASDLFRVLSLAFENVDVTRGSNEQDSAGSSESSFLAESSPEAEADEFLRGEQSGSAES